jgi:putative NADH-flavin reductase
MKLLILGATGKVGSELVKQGLERGFEVTVLVRSPAKVQIKDRRLNVVAGNPLDEKSLSQVVAGKDVVLCALGHTDLKESRIVTEAAQALIAAMNANTVKRLIAISSTLVSPGGSFLTKLPRYITRHALNDSAGMEKAVTPTALAWTIVRLARLTNERQAAYRIFENEPPSVTASISRKTVAACMLDLISDHTHFQKTISIDESRQEKYPDA